MRPLEKVRTVPPDAAASEVLELMVREDVNQVPVVRTALHGSVSRGHVLQVLRTRAELNA